MPTHRTEKHWSRWLSPLVLLVAVLSNGTMAQAQITVDDDDATTIVVDDPNFEPMKIAIAPFLASPDLTQRADDIRAIVEANLDECTLCDLCLEAAPGGKVRVVKLYDN